MNKAILVGRLTKGPELRSTGSGISVVNFTVAIQRKFKDANGERQTDFINCVAFNKTADFLKSWFSKGNMISIDGSIQTRTWDDNDGKRHYATEVIANDVGFVGGKSEKQDEDNPDGLKELATLEEEPSLDDDLPF